ncbi:MAG: YqcC family protein [Pseudomonadales bacterium]|nr:YqcC family protein [Pseudomonadales bacterium]
MADIQLLKALLKNIETEMREIDLWSEQPPAASAFESQIPFFADSMLFGQWLQWVFVARFQALLEGGHPLPPKCDIHPMAEEAFKEVQAYTDPLLALLKRFDEEINTA